MADAARDAAERMQHGKRHELQKRAEKIIDQTIALIKYRIGTQRGCKIRCWPSRDR